MSLNTTETCHMDLEQRERGGGGCGGRVGGAGGGVQ